MKNIRLSGVDRGTWIRTAVLLAALVNQGLVILGVTEKSVDVDRLTAFAAYGVTACSAVWSWWKNNSFTGRAQQADIVLRSEPDAKG